METSAKDTRTHKTPPRLTAHATKEMAGTDAAAAGAASKTLAYKQRKANQGGKSKSFWHSVGPHRPGAGCSMLGLDWRRLTRVGVGNAQRMTPTVQVSRETCSVDCSGFCACPGSSHVERLQVSHDRADTDSRRNEQRDTRRRLLGLYAYVIAHFPFLSLTFDVAVFLARPTRDTRRMTCALPPTVRRVGVGCCCGRWCLV